MMASTIRILRMVLILWLGVATPGVATTPSWRLIRMDPLAVNDAGQVLFRYIHAYNRMGSYLTDSWTWYGWLVVDRQGLWEDIPHVRLLPKDRTPAEESRWIDQHQRYREDFDAPLGPGFTGLNADSAPLIRCSLQQVRFDA